MTLVYRVKEQHMKAKANTKPQLSDDPFNIPAPIKITITKDDIEIMQLINAFMRMTGSDFDDVAYMLGLTAKRAKKLKDSYGIKNAEHMNELVLVMKKMQRA